MSKFESDDLFNSQIKLKDLCFSNDENFVLIPPTQRRSNTVQYRADWALKDIIKLRLDLKTNLVPLTLRKRKLYEKAKEDFNKSFSKTINFFTEKHFAPIMLRKHLLYLKTRAG